MIMKNYFKGHSYIILVSFHSAFINVTEIITLKTSRKQFSQHNILIQKLFVIFTEIGHKQIELKD